MGKKHSRKAAKQERKAEKRGGREVRAPNGLAEIRRFLRTSETPLWFVSPSPFALLGVDRWARRLEFVAAFDPFGGRHPGVVVPRHLSARSSRSATDACNRLLASPDVVERTRERDGGIALVGDLDESTARLARALGLRLAAPSSELRGRLATPAVAAALAAETGLRPVPSVVGRASGYGVLHALAVSAGLGRDLVVTTPEDEEYAVGSEADWQRHAGALGGRELTLQTRAERRTVVVSAVVTRHGTLVAASPAEVTRLPGLTPLGGARLVSRSELPDEERTEARRCAQLMGDRLCEEGYRGWFELELVIEVETGAIHFGALAQTVSDAGARTNVAAIGNGAPPLVLFHLLEHMGVDYELGVDAVNAVAEEADDDGWSVLHLEDDADDDDLFARAPRSGVWRIDPTAPAGIHFARRETDWRTVTGDDEGFYLRLARAGERRRPGADIGVLVARERLESEGRPTKRALEWGAGIARRLQTPARTARRLEPVTRA